MKKFTVMFLIFLFAHPLFSFGQETTNNKNLDAISGRYAECAAYYGTIQDAMDSSLQKDSAETYRQLANTAKIYSLLLAIEGRSQNSAVAVTKARFDRYMDNMKGESARNDENFTTFNNKYQSECRDAMEHPSTQLVDILMAMMRK